MPRAAAAAAAAAVGLLAAALPNLPLNTSKG